MGLVHHLDYLKSLHENLNTVFIEQSQVTEDYPESVSGVSITYITREDIKALTKRGKKIDLIVIRPAEVTLHSVKLAIIDFRASYHHKTFHYANGGGSTFEFKYNCNKDSFELVTKKQGGI